MVLLQLEQIGHINLRTTLVVKYRGTLPFLSFHLQKKPVSGDNRYQMKKLKNAPTACKWIGINVRKTLQKLSIPFRNVRNKAIHCWKRLMILLCYLSPANKYMLKFNNRNSRTRCKTCLKLTIKTLAQRHCFGLNLQF